MRTLPKSLLLLAALLPCLRLAAQPVYQHMDEATFIQGGSSLQFPYAGGLNSPQFSVKSPGSGDFADLFIFDGTGDNVTVFRRNGTAGSVTYLYDQLGKDKFPAGLHDWVLLRDFDCDGREDLFMGNDGGVQVYRDDGAGGTYVWTLVKSMLMSDLGLGPVPLQVIKGDIPDISDIDGDGDLDILSFNSAGSFVIWHKNLSQETYGSCDSLLFSGADLCWGKFQEAGADNTVTLDVFCRYSPYAQDEPTPKSLHGGSTLLSFDQDNDGDHELLIGDLLASNLVYLHNDGTPTAAHMDSMDFNFPSADVSVALELFVGAFMFDMDEDGDPDLVAAPNTDNVSYDFDNAWLYRNTGSSSSMTFQLETDNFLQENMIDLGTGAYPGLVDYNGDGLLDIIAGNESFKNPAMDISGLTLYLNTGTATAPIFTLETRDLNGYSSLFSPQRFGYSPAFADMDGDGDSDMLMGDSDGRINYFENTAGAGNPMLFATPVLNYKGIDVGQYSTIAIADIDGDGLKDIVTGEYMGNLEYYRNIGTTSVPNFSSTAITKTFGKIDTQIPCCEGFSVPFIFSDGGTLNILVGSERGNIWHYTVNPDSINSGAFPLVDSTFHDIREGTRTSVTGGDLNGDGRMDLVIGNVRGGLAIYEDYIPSATEDAGVASPAFAIYPNPSQGRFTVERLQGAAIGATVTLMDLKGSVLQRETMTGMKLQVDGSTFAKGIYVVRVEDATGVTHLKWVRQ
jgi:hypothetical protein